MGRTRKNSDEKHFKEMYRTKNSGSDSNTIGKRDTLKRSLRVILKAKGTSSDARPQERESRLRICAAKLLPPFQKALQRNSNFKKCTQQKSSTPSRTRKHGQMKQSQKVCKASKHVSKGKKIALSSKSNVQPNQSTKAETKDDLRERREVADIQSSAMSTPENKEKWNTPTKAQFLTSFSTERHDYDKKEITRFCDVAFLDDQHILAIDDNFRKKQFGQRICCFNLDGTLVCELPLPSHPWSVVALNSKEAVVSQRDCPFQGLIWLSVDVIKRSIEITKRTPIARECHGLAFNGEVFLLSYFGKGFLSVLDSSGKEIRRIRKKAGSHYRCFFLNNKDTFIYINMLANTVIASDLKGKELFSLQSRDFWNPIALSVDKYGQIYIGSYGSGVVTQFDGKKELGSVCHVESICGLAINSHSDLMAISHGHCISLFNLHRDDRPE